MHVRERNPKPGLHRPNAVFSLPVTKPLKPMQGPPLRLPTKAFASTTALPEVRSVMHVEAQRLVTHRTQSHALHEGLSTQRMLELLDKELQRPLTSSLAPSSIDEAGAPSRKVPFPERGLFSSGQALQNESKTSGKTGAPSTGPHPALAVLEKIEWMVREARPTLSLQLFGSRGPCVELFRKGPGVIGLRLSAGAALPPRFLEQLDEALLARALKLCVETEKSPGQ